MVCTNCENPHGEFVYPPGVDNLQYNYADTLRAEWKTDYVDDNPCALSLYWWVTDGNWTLSDFNTTVPCSGSQDVPLNIREDGWYLAQLNLNHTYPNGSSNLILTGLFNVNHDTDENGKLWKDNNDDLSSISVSGSSATSTSSASLEVVTSLPPTSSIRPHSSTADPSLAAETSAQASSQASTSSSSSISAGAIAGAVVGVVLGLAFLAGLGFLFLRRRRRQKQQIPQHIPPSQQIWPQYQPPVEKPGDYYPPHSEPRPPAPPEKILPQRRVFAELGAGQGSPAELDAPR